MKEIKLRVHEAVQDDVNKGIVRIDSNYMQQIGVKPGDIVEIEGERKTAGIVGRAYPGDIGSNTIRTDPLIRRNAKTAIGEVVTVRKAEIMEAKKVTIAPARKDIRVTTASPIIFQRGLFGRVVRKGDIVSLGGAAKRKATMSDNPFFDDVLSNMFDENYGLSFGLGSLKFMVVDTNPKTYVFITDNTQVECKPEAVDVAEEESAIAVAYEDIGGLSDEIKKIREMVELPLKHPEIFTRLGIEAPKGVLLHGPPGTGKTLLAKAVAYETNSNFVLINGPEIMGKFYGQSLPYEEKILIKQNGMLKRIPIGEIVEQNIKDIEAVCFDKNGKVVIKPVTDLIKHRLASKILEVKTRSGRKIKVTDDHSLFTMGNNGIEDTKTSALKKGAHIAVPNILPFNKHSIDEIDLLDELKENDYGIVVRNVQHHLKNAINKLGSKTVASILGVKERYLYDIKSKNVGIPVGKYCNLMKTAGIEINRSFLQLSTKGKSLPCALKLTEDLCLFLGLWLAEGSYTNNNEVRISIHRNEESLFADLCTKLFGTVTIYRKKNSLGSDIYICSGILGKVMKNVLGFNSGARNKKIPDLIYNLSRQNLSAFLRGYFSGDGSLNTKTPAPMIEACTESPELADDIAYLLLQFGIVAKIYDRKGRSQKRICFADRENLEKFREIGFIDEIKNRIISQYLQKQKFSRRDQIPISRIIKNLVESDYNLSSWRNSKTIGKQVLAQELSPKIAVKFADIYWDEVLEINEVKNNYEYVYDISVPGCENFVSGFGGVFAHNSEENIRKKFEEAEKNAPSIVFIDEIDAIATKREDTHGEVERRVVAQLLTLMDGLKSRGKVVVIAASNIPNALDPALRRPGRFDREIELGVPKKEGRLDILKIHTRNMPLADDVSLLSLADVTHGFVGADLAALAKESAMIVLRKFLPDLKLDEEEPIPKDILEKMILHQKDFEDALKVVRPSAMREVLVEIPDTKWDDIGGLGNVKQELIEAVEWPLKNPESFKRLGIKPPKGILLYGAPGTGKTMLAKAVANESDANFILIKGPSLLSKWVGESEKAVRKIFDKARQTSPCIICFDELDAIAPKRGVMGDSQVTERVVNQLLTEMDGIEELNQVVIIACTNRPDMIDTALLRQGRFDRIILCDVPEEETRYEIFKTHTKNMPLNNVDLKQLAAMTDGYTGADIEGICREAAILSLRENMSALNIEQRHFEEALRKVGPSVTPEIQKSYQKLLDKFRNATAREMVDKEAMSYLG